MLAHRILIAVAALFALTGLSFGFQPRPSSQDHPLLNRSHWGTEDGRRKESLLQRGSWRHRMMLMHPTSLNNSPRTDDDSGGGGGPVLTPSYDDDNNPGRFDSACVANPVVLPPSKRRDKWQMYYYGNAGSWNRGLPAFLPTGWCGLAESDDGIRWTKVEGSAGNGAILAPSDDPDDWDSVHIGVGDVVRVPSSREDGSGGEEELQMYYFGGSSEPVTLGNMGGLAGFRMRIGRARSADGGRTWEKMGVCLDYDEAEGVFASWPRILLPSKDGNPYKMIYHAFNGKKWRVFGAESLDRGATWNRTGLILEGESDDEDSFDFSGIGTRAVVPWRGGLLMIYEAVCRAGKHRLGAAYCADHARDGGSKWEKIRDIDGCSRPGGPILEPGTGAMGPWTSTVVGTPYLVAMSDGSLRLYFVGKAGDEGHSIGCLRSETGDISPGSWRSLSE